MNTFKIFLASSLTELQEDRLEISSYILDLNDQSVEQNLYFKLFMCEDEDISMARSRKQSEYNNFICESQLTIFLFYKKVGEYTKEEFDVAYEHFKAVGTPELMIFFRETETTGDIENFQSYLTDKKIAYYPYSDIEEVERIVGKWLEENLASSPFFEF